jgi:hypothetical protein
MHVVSPYKTQPAPKGASNAISSRAHKCWATRAVMLEWSAEASGGEMLKSTPAPMLRSLWLLFGTDQIV